MKLTIEATERITSIDGVKARAWKGTTERGVPVVVFVHRIAIDNSRDSAELDRELVETMPPGREVPLVDALEQTAREAVRCAHPGCTYQREPNCDYCRGHEGGFGSNDPYGFKGRTATEAEEQ